MPGLYKKVLKGHYPKIPTIYSNDLNNIIKAMLQVSAHMRPICGEIKFRNRKDSSNALCH